MRSRNGISTMGRWSTRAMLGVGGALCVLLAIVCIVVQMGKVAHQGTSIRKAMDRKVMAGGRGGGGGLAEMAEDVDDYRLRSLYDRAAVDPRSGPTTNGGWGSEMLSGAKDARREQLLARSPLRPKALVVPPALHKEITANSVEFKKDFGSVLVDTLGPVGSEKYLAEPLYGDGGDHFFERVIQGRISLAPNQPTNAIAWGDSIPNSIQRNTILRPFKTVSYTFSEEELLHMHHNMDVVISWVNGTEINHRWHKYAANNLPKDLQSRKNGGWFPTQTEAGGKQLQLNTLSALERYLGGSTGSRFTSTMDREHDELRYLIRSLHTNMKWHCGRLIVVSPGHIPRWLNRARNFFQKSVPSRERVGKFDRCENSVDRRIIFVHQDSIIPSALRLTFNTNTIEAYIHRIRRLSSLYVHLNDDYMFRKPTAVSSFVNTKGGPVLLFESGRIRGWYQGQKWHAEQGWLGGVFHTNGFVEEVFSHGVHGDADPFRSGTVRRLLQAGMGGGLEMGVDAEGGGVGGPKAQGSNNPLSDWADDDMDISFALSDMRNPPESVWPRPRFFLKHAPFVVCRNMYKRQLLRYFKSRFSRAGKEHLRRSSLDYIPPQTHHAFVTDVPWAASSNFRPHHMSGSMRRAADEAVMKMWEMELEQQAGMGVETPDEDVFYLDNEDGCAPALLKIGDLASAHVATFTDDMKRNEKLLAHVDKTDPMFFTINDNGYSNAEVEEMLSKYASSHFPYPSAAEHPDKMVYGLQRGRMVGNRDPRVPVIRNSTTSTAPPANETKTTTSPPPVLVVGGRWRVPGLVAVPEKKIKGHGQDLVDDDTEYIRGGGASPQAYFEKTTERLYTPAPDEQLFHEVRYNQFNALPLILSIHVSVPDLVVCAMLRSLKIALPDHEGHIFVYREGVGLVPEGMTPYDARPIVLCTEYNRQRVEFLRNIGTGTLVERVNALNAKWRPAQSVDPVLSRTDAVVIRVGCVTALGQTLALEDFSQRTIADTLNVLHLEAPCPKVKESMTPSDLDPTAVNWVLAPTGQMLLQTYPLPYRRYEPGEKITYGY